MASKLQKLASEIAKREGKKSQARIGDIREILKIFFTMLAEDMINQTDNVGGVMGEQIDKIYQRMNKKLEKKK